MSLTRKQTDRHVARLARLGCEIEHLEGGFAITRHRQGLVPLVFHYLVSDDEDANALLERATRELNDNEPLP